MSRSGQATISAQPVPKTRNAPTGPAITAAARALTATMSLMVLLPGVEDSVEDVAVEALSALEEDGIASRVLEGVLVEDLSGEAAARGRAGGGL